MSAKVPWLQSVQIYQDVPGQNVGGGHLPQPHLHHLQHPGLVGGALTLDSYFKMSWISDKILCVTRCYGITWLSTSSASFKRFKTSDNAATSLYVIILFGEGGHA